MEAKDTVMSPDNVCNVIIDIVELRRSRSIDAKDFAQECCEAVAEKQAEISFKVGVSHEQERMTKALRDLHKQGWTLADVIQAEDAMGEAVV